MMSRFGDGPEEKAGNRTILLVMLDVQWNVDLESEIGLVGKAGKMFLLMATFGASNYPPKAAISFDSNYTRLFCHAGLQAYYFCNSH